MAISFGAEKIAYQGYVFDPYILIELKTKARNFDLSWSHFFGPIYADQMFHGYYYNVGEKDATQSRPTYSAESGYSGYKYTTSLNGWKGLWGYGVFFRYDSLRSAVFRDSPLLETKINLTGGVGLIYLLYSESKF
ncbi:MAG: MipA/OmpV family protein [Oligoflexales bacterium]|nr:MipA/OmpV family protein [Oligoflexales bacterium]